MPVPVVQLEGIVGDSQYETKHERHGVISVDVVTILVVYTRQILDVVIAKLCVPLGNRTQSFGNSPRLPLSTPLHQPFISLCW